MLGCSFCRCDVRGASTLSLSVLERFVSALTLLPSSFQVLGMEAALQVVEEDAEILLTSITQKFAGGIKTGLSRSLGTRGNLVRRQPGLLEQPLRRSLARVSKNKIYL